MFGLFKNTKPKLTITPEDKEWVETNLIWLGETFGFERVKQTPFYLPITDYFPYTNLKDEEQFEKLFCQLCEIIEVKREEILVAFFDDDRLEWTVGDGKYTGGTFESIKQDDKKYKISILKENLSDIERLIAVITHELVHVKLLGGNYVNRDDADMEGLTDLACLYFGFGVFLANGYSRTYGGGAWSRVGYLHDEIIAYSNALLCKISGQNYSDYLEWFNNNTKVAFERNFKYLSKNGETRLDSQEISRVEKFYELDSSIVKGFESKNYELVVQKSILLVELDSKKSGNWNYLGYAHLMLGNFNEAAKCFNKAISLDPFWGVLFSNRAFCKIQLSDFDGAHTDITTALEFDDENNYAWRDLGIYHLSKEEYSKGLDNLLKAYEMNIGESLDLIHFYLAKAYDKLGDIKKQTFHNEKSAELGETTLSFLKSYKY